MPPRFVVFVCALTLIASGCEEKKAPEAEEVKEKKPEVVRAKAPPGPEVAQCQEILDKGWKSIQPALARLKIEDPASLEPRYKASAKNFLMRCQKLSGEMRACLAKVENPFQGIGSCKTNEGKRVAERLYPPRLGAYIKLFEPQPLDEKRGAELLASLKGRWVNDWKAAGTRTTWTIGKPGKVIEESKLKSGQVRKREFGISFVQTGRMLIEWKTKSTQPFMFFKPGRKVFYASGNLAYGFYPMENRESFVVQNGGDYVFFDHQKCEVISSTGSIVDGECMFTERKKEKIFKVKYQIPGRLLVNGKPRIDQRAYYPVGKFLLHESLVAAGKYVRK